MLDIFARDLSDLNASIIYDHLQMYLEIEFKTYNNPIIKSIMRVRKRDCIMFGMLFYKKYEE